MKTILVTACSFSSYANLTVGSTDALLTVAELLNYVSKPASGNEKATDQTSRFGHPQNGGQNQDHNRDGLHREVGLHPTKVCVVATNKRQGSIFRTNLLGIFGTGKYTYAVKGPGKSFT